MPGSPKKITETLYACFGQGKVWICLLMWVLVACTTMETQVTGTPQAVDNDEKESVVPGETEPSDVLETPESQPTNGAIDNEAHDELPTPISETRVESITITSDIIIPAYEPLAVPYSEWEAHRSQELLAVNGFGQTTAEWRRATQHSNGLIRSTAYYLLTRQPDPQDETLFRQGVDDIDQTVQAIAAYGLYRLGDKSALPILERLAQLDVNAFTVATRAAGILGEMGELAAFDTIQKAMDSDLGYIRVFAIQNAMPFVSYHGQSYTSDATIDIWDLYRRALQDEDAQVRVVAKMQLQELDTPEAQQLLEVYARGSQ
jgi:hypothetical protein